MPRTALHSPQAEALRVAMQENFSVLIATALTLQIAKVPLNPTESVATVVNLLAPALHSFAIHNKLDVDLLCADVLSITLEEILTTRERMAKAKEAK